jgi:hypothetical protein
MSGFVFRFVVFILLITMFSYEINQNQIKLCNAPEIRRRPEPATQQHAINSVPVPVTV